MEAVVMANEVNRSGGGGGQAQRGEKSAQAAPSRAVAEMDNGAEAFLFGVSDRRDAQRFAGGLGRGVARRTMADFRFNGLRKRNRECSQQSGQQPFAEPGGQ